MKRLQLLGFTAACGFVLAACTTDEQTATEAGEIQLSQTEISKILPGSTIKGRGPRGKFASYYHKDGRKLTKQANQVAERRWWVNDSGQWCETHVVDESTELCGVRVYKAGRSLTWYSEKGAVIGSFYLVTGDPLKLDQPYPKIRPANSSELPPTEKYTVE